MLAKDLTESYPRSPFDAIDGYLWLPRLIDKVRAKQAGKLGEYIPFPCGSDKRFLETFWIDADSLEQVILSGASDEAIARWCREHARHRPEEVGESYRAKLLAPSPAESQERLAQARAQLSATHPDLDLGMVDSFIKLILVDEGHPFPASV